MKSDVGRLRHVVAGAIAIALGLWGYGCVPDPPQDSVSDEAIRESLEAFRNRTIYTALDSAVLAEIPDDDLEMAIVDYVDAKIGDRYDRAAEIVRDLPEGIRALYLTWIVEAEVNNGGFNQYYWNTGGEFAAEAVDAFEYFGATDHARLMEEANAVRAREEESINELQAEGTMEAFSESYEVSELGPLDTRFYELTDDLSALRIAKIRAVPEEFSGD